MTGQLAAITLNMIPGLGSIKIQRLMEFFGSPEIVLHANAHVLAQVKGISAAQAASIASWRTTTNAEKELELAQRAGVRITTLFDDDYPQVLRNISDPPIVLYSRGEWKACDENRAVSIVGSRMASHYGRLVAKRFSHELAEAGVTIVSGLARGIDTEAHKAALDAGGRTIAIIGSGFNHFYPPENERLAQMIADGHGAVVSEFPMDMRPGKSTFPMRNRVISAWSSATLVVEAPLRSGSLITAREAVEQGRRVFAVPGPIDRDHSEGCHELIRDGATLVSNTRQIIDELGWGENRSLYGELALFDELSGKHETGAMLLNDEALVYGCIESGRSNLESLCSSLGMQAFEVTPVLARLQIKRSIAPVPGGEFKVCR